MVKRCLQDICVAVILDDIFMVNEGAGACVLDGFGLSKGSYLWLEEQINTLSDRLYNDGNMSGVGVVVGR